jgi:type II secretory pathway component PulM
MKANRALFKKYLRTSDQQTKYQTEKILTDDDFAMEALEGFQSQKDAWQSFEAFDRKFHQKKRRQNISLLGLALFLSIVVGWNLIPTTPDSKPSHKEKALIKAPSIKIHQKEDINQMTTAATAVQISPQQVLMELNTTASETNQRLEPLERIQQIPAQQIEFNKQKGQRLALKIGRELIIKNFKTIDYRYYRKENDGGQQAYTENDLGEQTLKVPYINLLNKAVVDFSKEDYKLALLYFDEILHSYPDDANALFYGAMCLYNLQEYGQAEGRFLKLQNIPFANFREEGNWYLLHVYQQTKKEAAFSSLRNLIIEEKGFYAQKAENLRLH